MKLRTVHVELQGHRLTAYDRREDGAEIALSDDQWWQIETTRHHDADLDIDLDAGFRLAFTVRTD